MNDENSKINLRKRAESIITHELKDYSNFSREEIYSLIHDLNVHQIELEMQNEQLKLTRLELENSRNRFVNLFDNAPVGYMRLDEYGAILQTNQTMLDLLGYSHAEVNQKYFANFIVHEDRGMFSARYQAFYKRPQNKSLELRLIKKDFSSVETEIKARLVDGSLFNVNPANQQSYLLINIQEVSKRKKAEDELKLAAKVFENSEEGIMIVDADSKILKVNFSFSAITGYEANEAIGKTPRILKSGRHSKEFYKTMWGQINRNGYWQGEIWNRRKNGDLYAEWLSITCVQDKYGRITHYIGIFSDITLRKQSEQQIEKLAHFDVLTELPNRTLLNDRLKQAIVHSTRQKQYLSVLFLDLDRFKTLNDTLGHFVGDLLLQDVAKRLLACVRESDTVARFGGDEFVIILSDFNNAETAQTTSTHISEAILSALSIPFELQENQLLTTTSIGYAIFPHDGKTVNELIKNADSAMYHAKSQGRNNFQQFAEFMRENDYKQGLFVTDIQNALHQQQFKVYYQPKIDLLKTGKPTGFEALLRWQHPQRGFVPQEDFIRVAEDSGIIIELGLWVLNTACLQLKTWHQQGHDGLTISVNLSARQLVQSNLIEKIKNILQQCGLEAKYLDLEITETAMMENMSEAIKILKVLTRMGCTVSLDDFGTGYSSLTYLKKFPVQAIKIDCSFIADIINNPDDKVIVNSIISIAKHMRLKVIAEGIENQQQADYLIKQGCSTGQGYLFCKPLPATEITAWL